MEFNFSSFFEHLLPSSWFESLSHSQGFDMTHDEVTQSVHDASDFFHIDDPMVVKEGWTTGVYPNMTLTEMDDVLIYNREQMTDMGITEKYAFDLIMTHEGTHRMLQGMNTGFSPHQEELCCDYMAGVRAGLNGLDVSQMEDSLVNSHASASHPDGHSRVESIEKGVEFAEHYMKEHGVPPTFTECIEYFSENVLEDHILAWVTLREEGTPAIPQGVQSMDTEGEMKAYTQSEINANKSRAEHEMRVQESYMRHHQNIAASKARMGEPHEASDHQFNVARDKYNAAKRDYQKWSSMKPDIKGFTQADVDWYEHQARISSGSEQAHWLKEAQWARDHIHSFVAEDGAGAPEAAGQEVYEFHHGGQYGNATGDYWDDSHPVDGDHIKGIFIDNKATQLHYAQEAKENAEWHEKRSNDCIARGDLAGAKDHAARAASYRRAERDAIAASKKCTK